MTLSEIRRRVDALKRRFAREIAILKLRQVAEAVSDEWDPSEPPEPGDVIRRIADAGFRISTFVDLGRCFKDIRLWGDVPEYEAIVFNLLPWASHDRYCEFFRWDLSAPAR